MKFKCAICNVYFPHEGALKYHAWMEHDRKAFEDANAHGSWD